MSSPASPSDVPIRALVELAKTRDGLMRWLRLRLLLETLTTGPRRDDEAYLELEELLRAAQPEAEVHASSLVAFYRTHAERVNALLTEALKDLDSGRIKDRMAKASPDFAAAGERRASYFAELSRSELERTQRDSEPAANNSPRETFCAALATLQFDSDVACISTGDPLECAFADLVAELSDTYC
jgi:hypothetical protein